MVNMGRSSPYHHQQCMAHGIHLSVCDVLYKSRSRENIDRQNTCDILVLKKVTGDKIEISIDDDITTLVEQRDDYDTHITIHRCEESSNSSENLLRKMKHFKLM